jgi:hypothetical protein
MTILWIGWAEAYRGPARSGTDVNRPRIEEIPMPPVSTSTFGKRSVVRRWMTAVAGAVVALATVLVPGDAGATDRPHELAAIRPVMDCAA